MSFSALCKNLEEKIKSSYEEGVSLEVAEKLAAEFLYAQIQVSEELKKADLDSRMRKTGVKAVRAAIYTDTCAKADKKPTESALEMAVNMNELVQNEQNDLDKSEVERDDLSRYYSIFKEGHIYFRGIAKGKFE
jgi:hypothetical protein